MKKTRVGITMGDPSGIGPSILLKAIRRLRGSAEFLIIGDAWVLGKVENALGARLFKYQGVRLIDLKNVPRKDFAFGKIRAEYGKASIEYLDKAMDLLIAKEIDCLVTCPISKEAVKLAGFRFPGHTEYLAQCTATRDFAMMLLNRRLKFSLLTTHIPLKDVSSQINKGIIRKNIVLVVTSLKKLWAIKKPRIVVCGLNPHASDGGIIGKEELAILKPALKGLRIRLKAVIEGPVSSDAAILKASKGKFDAVVAMYHDQALIPLKLTGYETGVNMTLGLPFVRTSPLHGTAFDIAAIPSLADPSSLIEAIKLAVKCTSTQKKA
jgi:4-hydroxythreonine-4-phosphate dehydrogenase